MTKTIAVAIAAPAGAAAFVVTYWLLLLMERAW